jgi:hypothetical protein
VLRIGLNETWYRIPDARDSRVMRPSLGRLSTFESPWEAWRDPIRVLIRVLQSQDRCASRPSHRRVRNGADSGPVRPQPQQSAIHSRKAASLKSPLATARMARSVSSGSPGAGIRPRSRSSISRLRTSAPCCGRRAMGRTSGWIDLPILDETGFPKQRRGVTDVPGLHFLGSAMAAHAGVRDALRPDVGRALLARCDGCCDAKPRPDAASAAGARAG